jgi:SIT4-associating protein SAP185/190
LKAIITISANATTQDQSVIGPNELTRQLVSESCLKQLIDFMLQGGNPLTVGVGIIIEVIRKNNSDYDLENQIGPVPKNSDPIYLGTLLREFATHIPKFMDLVNSPSQIVTQRDGSTTTKKRELKTAFGEKIEPLGFDRFKTCELMAELLHCSNMALLNERGSEAEVRRRDAERERLKADGKLTSATAGNLGEFSTSVDSQGFHHARAPSMDSPAEIKPLQVQNSSEDDFEKVIAPEVAPETSKDTATEKEQIGEPLERSPKVAPSRRSQPLARLQVTTANLSMNHSHHRKMRQHLLKPLILPQSLLMMPNHQLRLDYLPRSAVLIWTMTLL